MVFSPDFLEELRRRLTLSTVVARKVKLTRKGREFTGLCPFHAEKSPSFFVTDEKRFYHCFGCGAHGDAISFVMKAQGLEFLEAVETLAAQAGLEVPSASLADRRRYRRSGLEAVCEAASLWFAQQLQTPGAREALAYLSRRKVSKEQIGEFRLGWAPNDKNALKKALLAQGFSEESLIEAGLLIQLDNQAESYDRFRGRIVFPIADAVGRAIAFGGRLLGDGQPKYLNSPETPLFSKGRSLYGHHLARKTSRNPGQKLIVTEGYLDVIALHRCGFPCAVAPLGTALSDEQLVQLWSMSDEPILCFDGDAAGLRAAERVLERALPLLQPGRSLRFVSLPQGQDPDDLLCQPGGEALFACLLDRTQPLVDKLWAVERARQPLDTPERRAWFRRRVHERVACIQDRDVRAFYRQEFQQRLVELFSPQTPRHEKRTLRRHGPGGWPLPLDPFIKDRPEDKVTRDVDANRLSALLLALINHPQLIEEMLEALAEMSFDDRALDSLRQEIVNTAAAMPGLDAATLQAYLAKRGQGSILAQIAHRDIATAYPFTRRDAEIEMVRESCLELFQRVAACRIALDLEEVGRQTAQSLSEEAWQRFKALAQAGQQARGLAVDEE